jgi:hypothetical protein
MGGECGRKIALRFAHSTDGPEAPGYIAEPSGVCWVPGGKMTRVIEHLAIDRKGASEISPGQEYLA